MGRVSASMFSPASACTRSSSDSSLQGFTPMEALQTATLNPARFLGMEDKLGTIEKGKLADLVLLDANPLDDIRNTQKIAAVIVNGRYLSRGDLDKLLVGVEAAAKNK